MLMLVAAVPWLVRWYPPADSPQEALTAVIPIPEETDIEVLPPLYAKATPVQAVSWEDNNGMAEILDGLVVPVPVGGPQ